MQVCRICLAEDTKMYDMGLYNLKACYETLTSCPVMEDSVPHSLCCECATRLQAGHRLRGKALRSQALLAGLAPFNQYNITKKLQSIDREKHNLVSTLTCHTFIDYNDLHLHETSYNKENSISDEAIPELDFNTDAIKSENEETTELQYDMESLNDEFGNKAEKSKRVKKVEPKIDRRRRPASEVLSEAVFAISDLTYYEQVEEIRKRSETANYRNSVFKCEDCFKGFSDEDAYNSHVVRHTDQCGPYVCDICKTHFKHQRALKNHATSHLQKFSCKCCPYVTTRRHAAKLHEDFHNGTRYKCPHCMEMFDKSTTYLGHLRIKHPSDFLCQFCGYSFVSEKGLGLHKTLKHRLHQPPIPENGPYCQRCDVRFANQDALDKHIKLSPTHNDGQIIKEIGTRKRSKKRVATGAHSDKPEGPIPCEQCDMQLPDSLSYYRHFRRMHPDKNRTNYPSMKKKCMCEVCGKMFQSLALLQDHSFTHTDAKLFKCQQCEKTFQRKYRLIAHRRLHREARAAHPCGTCGKRFTTASNRQRHMFSHTGLKPFKCEMCGKCFKHASEKRAHITYVHLKKPWPKRARGKRRPETRQVQQPQQLPSVDTEIVQPLWPGCNDPKIDKPMYA